ncbi:MAG: DUF1579 domain-containing protein [Pirellulaceae bacterium]
MMYTLLLRNKLTMAMVGLGFVSFFATSIDAQPPGTSAEHEVLKQDVGTWKATVKMWMGPDGQTDPAAEPTVSEGEEVNRMLGPFWVVSKFTGDFAGLEFEGHSLSGYDSKLKKYVGSWVDSVSPNAMHMVGTYDAKTKTLTSQTTGVGMDGQEAKGRSVLVYKDENHRTLTMYEIKDGKEIKSMEINYERKK